MIPQIFDTFREHLLVTSGHTFISRFHSFLIMLSSCFLNSYGYLSFMSFTAGLFLTNRMMFPNYLCGPEDEERILKVTKKSVPAEKKRLDLMN